MFASNQDQIKGVKFTSPSEIDKIHTKYLNKSLWDSGHQKMKEDDSWEIRNKWSDIYRCPSLVSWRVSRPWHKKEELRWSPEHTPRWEDEPESLSRSKYLEFSGQMLKRRDLHRERNPWFCRWAPWVVSSALIITCTSGNYLRPGNHWKGLEVMRPSSYPGRTVPVAMSQCGKSQNWGRV